MIEEAYNGFFFLRWAGIFFFFFTHSCVDRVYGSGGRLRLRPQWRRSGRCVGRPTSARWGLVGGCRRVRRWALPGVGVTAGCGNESRRSAGSRKGHCNRAGPLPDAVGSVTAWGRHGQPAVSRLYRLAPCRRRRAERGCQRWRVAGCGAARVRSARCQACRRCRGWRGGMWGIVGRGGGRGGVRGSVGCGAWCGGLRASVACSGGRAVGSSGGGAWGGRLLHGRWGGSTSAGGRDGQPAAPRPLTAGASLAAMALCGGRDRGCRPVRGMASWGRWAASWVLGGQCGLRFAAPTSRQPCPASCGPLPRRVGGGERSAAAAVVDAGGGGSERSLRGGGGGGGLLARKPRPP